MTDKAKVREKVNIERSDEKQAKEVHGIKPTWRVEKYAEGDDPEEDEPFETIEHEGNVFLDEGVNLIWNAINGGTITAFDNTNAEIGVGDGTAAEDSTQTGLQGDNTLYKGMLSGYPEISGQQITFRAEFTDDEANFSWDELTVRNDADDAGDKDNLNRLQQDMGTKSSGTTWTAELILEII